MLMSELALLKQNYINFDNESKLIKTFNLAFATRE